MRSITLAIDEELKLDMKGLPWVNWSELTRKELLEDVEKEKVLLKQLNSKEEQELIKWSVELGRKAKKESFKRLLSELSPEIKKQVLKRLPKKRSLK